MGIPPYSTGSTLAMRVGLPLYLQACYKDHNAIHLQQCLAIGQQRATEQAALFPGKPTGTKSSFSKSRFKSTTSPYISELCAEDVAKSSSIDSPRNDATSHSTKVFLRDN